MIISRSFSLAKGKTDQLLGLACWVMARMLDDFNARSVFVDKIACFNCVTRFIWSVTRFFLSRRIVYNSVRGLRSRRCGPFPDQNAFSSNFSLWILQKKSNVSDHLEKMLVRKIVKKLSKMIIRLQKKRMCVESWIHSDGLGYRFSQNFIWLQVKSFCKNLVTFLEFVTRFHR